MTKQTLSLFLLLIFPLTIFGSYQQDSNVAGQRFLENAVQYSDTEGLNTVDYQSRVENEYDPNHYEIVREKKDSEPSRMTSRRSNNRPKSYNGFQFAAMAAKTREPKKKKMKPRTLNFQDLAGRLQKEEQRSTKNVDFNEIFKKSRR